MGFLSNFAIESAYAPSTVQTIRANERINQILYEERCIKEQIYLELLYVSAFSSTVKVSKTVFPVWNFVQSLKLYSLKQFFSIIANHSIELDFSTEIVVMLDMPSQYMHYCLVLLCEVYCVIV